MRYRELTEGYERLDDWWSRIEKECGDIIFTYRRQKAVFYRGASGSKGQIYRAEPLNNREALNSSQGDHEFLTMLMELAGEKVTRKNSIAMTSNPSMASGYGTVYIIFPCDGIQFIYSENTVDWYDFVEGFKDECLMRISSRFGDRLDLSALNYNGSRETNALIQLFRHQPIGKLKEVVLANQEPFMDYYEMISGRYHFNRSSIESALDSRHEVMFSGAPYYMIDESYAGQLSHKLGFNIG